MQSTHTIQQSLHFLTQLQLLSSYANSTPQLLTVTHFYQPPSPENNHQHYSHPKQDYSYRQSLVSKRRKHDSYHQENSLNQSLKSYPDCLANDSPNTENNPSQQNFKTKKSQLYGTSNHRNNSYINNITYFKLFKKKKTKNDQPQPKIQNLQDSQIVSKRYRSLLRKQSNSLISFANSRIFSPQKQISNNNNNLAKPLNKKLNVRQIPCVQFRKQRSNSCQENRLSEFSSKQHDAFKDLKNDIDHLKERMLRQPKVQSMKVLPTSIKSSSEMSNIVTINLNVSQFQKKKSLH